MLLSRSIYSSKSLEHELLMLLENEEDNDFSKAFLSLNGILVFLDFGLSVLSILSVNFNIYSCISWDVFLFLLTLFSIFITLPSFTRFYLYTDFC